MKYRPYIFMILGFFMWISGSSYIGSEFNYKNWSQQFRVSLVPNEEQSFDEEISRYYFDPFHLQMSPFGRTVALSMSGQLNKMWHFGGSHDSWKKVPKDVEFYNKAYLTIKNFEYLRYKRTNRAPQTEAMEQFIRQQTEKLVRGGYLLDPVNYEQFQAYGFFLAELTTRDVESRSFKALSNFTYEFSKTRVDIVSRMSGMTAAVNTLALMQLKNLESNNFFSNDEGYDFYPPEELVEASNVADQAVSEFVPVFENFLVGGQAKHCDPEFIKILSEYAIQTVLLQNTNRNVLLKNGLSLKLKTIPYDRFSAFLRKYSTENK